jgi:hypothetical protein
VLLRVITRLCRSNVSLVVLVVEGTRGIEFMFGIILSVVIANWVAHHIHHDGVYESELERIGNLYFLRDEPPHRYVTHLCTGWGSWGGLLCACVGGDSCRTGGGGCVPVRLRGAAPAA